MRLHAMILRIIFAKTAPGKCWDSFTAKRARPDPSPNLHMVEAVRGFGACVASLNKTKCSKLCIVTLGSWLRLFHLAALAVQLGSRQSGVRQLTAEAVKGPWPSIKSKVQVGASRQSFKSKVPATDFWDGKCISSYILLITMISVTDAIRPVPQGPFCKTMRR
jgi:hypothetical protein